MAMQKPTTRATFRAPRVPRLLLCVSIDYYYRKVKKRMEEGPLVRVCIVYDTKYGNTKLVAEEILEGLKEIEGIRAPISDVEAADLETLSDYTLF
jgi:flavorubredoxin